MKAAEIKTVFKIDDLRDLPDAINDLLSLSDRNNIYDDLINLNNGDLSKDWFQEVYEEELAQRNQNKQDFTPASVSRLCGLLTATADPIILLEPTAGNGGMIIESWNENKEIVEVECWELSNRSLPLLLFNLSIRGICGIVYHGDVLTQEWKQKYTLTRDSGISYSIITNEL